MGVILVFPPLFGKLPNRGGCMGPACNGHFPFPTSYFKVEAKVTK